MTTDQAGLTPAASEVIDASTGIRADPRWRRAVELTERDVDVILDAARTPSATVERLRREPYRPPGFSIPRD